jgi:hypothetical protein
MMGLEDGQLAWVVGNKATIDELLVLDTHLREVHRGGRCCSKSCDSGGLVHAIYKAQLILIRAEDEWSPNRICRVRRREENLQTHRGDPW